MEPGVRLFVSLVAWRSIISFGRGIHVGKAQKLGQVQLVSVAFRISWACLTNVAAQKALHKIEVQWSKNTEKASLKVDISEVVKPAWFGW